jgi:hypothetical protein
MLKKSLALMSLIAIAGAGCANAATGENPPDAFHGAKTSSHEGIYTKSAKCESPSGMRAKGEDGELDSSWVLIDVSKTKYAVKNDNITEFPVLAYGLMADLKVKPLPNGHLKIEGVVTCDELKDDVAGKIYSPGEWPGLNGMVALPVDAEMQIGKPVFLRVERYLVTLEIDKKR